MSAGSALLILILPSSASSGAESGDALVHYILDTATDSCIAAGDDAGRLREYAEKWKWTPATAEMAEKFKGTPNHFLGGWTFRIGDQSFAVIHTENSRDRSRSCTITTNLASERQFEALNAGWHRIMTPERHSDNLRPKKISHTDAFRREDQAEIVSTLTFNQSSRMCTLLVTFAPPDHPKHPVRKGLNRWQVSLAHSS